MLRALTVLLSGALLLSCAADDHASKDGGWNGDGGGSSLEASTVIVLPDTQFYACGYPSIFEAQAEWIRSERVGRSIALVVHTGDIVDSDTAPEWGVASTSLHRLDGEVPYLLATGNHDLDGNRTSRIGEYFTPEMYAAWPDEIGFFEGPRIDNSFGVVELAGKRWLFLGLEFGPRDAAVEWARAVIETHSDLPVALFTHAYLYADGERYDRRIEPLQPYHPDRYGVTIESGVNDGEDLYRALVEPFENVKLVMSGHVIPDGVARNAYRRASGSQVVEILANYQRCAVCPCPEVEGGGGYLRLLTFTEGEIAVSTYSPYLDEWLHDDDNEFSIEL